MAYHRYNMDEFLFLANNIRGRTYKELTEMFNAHFDLELSIHQIKRFTAQEKLSNGSDGRFKKGRIPPNKGKKGTGGYKPTQFKKGHRPANYCPIGTERVTVDGYTNVKVAEPNIWRSKHSLIWEEANGTIPENHVLLFGDGDRSNCDLDNLILIPRRLMSTINNKGLIQANAELTKMSIQIAEIDQKISTLKKLHPKGWNINEHD